MKFFASVCALSAVAFATLEPNKVEERQINDPNIPVSIEMVLFTALPTSLLALAITNQAAASSAIASEFASGTAPSWFQALPTNVQTYLLPASVQAAVTVAPNGTASPTNITAAPFAQTTGNVTNANGTLLVGPTITRNGTVYVNGTVASTRASNGTLVAATGNATMAGGRNGTAANGTMGGAAGGASMTGRATTSGASATGAGAGAAATSSRTSSSSGGASMPTGVISAGLAGIVAIAGVLAL